MNSVTDQELLERARRLEKQALSDIYDRWSEALYRYSMRLLGEPDLAEECVAEVFSRLLAALKEKHGPRDYLQAYLYRIAHNWITDFYRSKPSQPVPLPVDLQGQPAGDPPEVVAREMERRALITALLELTPDQRQVILLKYVEEWENVEVAKALQKPVGAVKSLQHRALDALRRHLERLDLNQNDEEEYQTLRTES